MDELHGTMEVALITGAFVLVAAFAVFEACEDFGLIADHNEVEHVYGWIWRAFITCCIWVFAAICIGYSAIPCAIGSAFLFSAVFRYCLNSMRGLHWAYLSPSAHYDWLFMRLTGKFGNRASLIKEWPSDYHGSNEVTDYVHDITHRAGTIAYIIEVAILAVCIFIAA
jgi:hypothetical protein